MKTAIARLALAASLCVSASAAQAFSTVFGQDLNASATNPLSNTPVSDAAETFFRSGLSGSVGTETFETQATGAVAPLGLTFPGSSGGISAILAGGNGVVTAVAPGTTNGLGRYSIPSSTSSKYWEVGISEAALSDVTITFGTAIAAFGFHAVDAGDFDQSLSIELYGAGATLLTTDNIIGGSPDIDGSVLFYGVRASDLTQLIHSIRFVSAGPNVEDAVGFDNLIVADACQAGLVTCDNGNGNGGVGIPEPGTLALLAAALLAFRGARRYRPA